MERKELKRRRHNWGSGFARTALAFLSIAIMASAPVRARGQASSAPAVREVTDETGRLVRLPAQVRRIVSLAPSLTETVYALGLEDKLVGDTDYCDYPPDAAKKHKVGGAINPNMEEIAALKPDVVLVVKSLNRLETVRALEQLGIPVYSADPHTVIGVIESMKKLSEVLGAEPAGAELEKKLRDRLAAMQTKLKDSPSKRVFFVVWTEPLQSIGRKTFIADLLTYSGATSVVDSQQDWPKYSMEEAVLLQPEYLVFASSHSENVKNDVEALATKPGWSAMEAIQKRKIAVVSDAINRPGPRIVDAVEELARQIHPEVFGGKN
jgi:iron complex transport system substrate-binding protein